MSSYPGDERAATELDARHREQLATATASRHSCDNPDWITPGWLVEAAREVMGSIDLDPASDAEAQEVVKAKSYITADVDGLLTPWHGNVFLNPPGGFVLLFWQRLVVMYHTGSIAQAVWIGYSLEQLQTLQSWDGESPLHFPICIPKRRIAFIENEAMKARRLKKIDEYNEAARALGGKLRPRKEKADSPSHANYITYLGPHVDRFARVFSQFGKVRR